MTSLRRNGFSKKWTVVALTAATLALAGCGRKGGLDLPPQASAGPQPAEADRPAAKGTVFDPSFGSDAPPAATARGSERGKRGFLLDPLLGN